MCHYKYHLYDLKAIYCLRDLAFRDKISQIDCNNKHHIEAYSPRKQKKYPIGPKFIKPYKYRPNFSITNPNLNPKSNSNLVEEKA